ncbi:hypothetical protein PHY01_14990 [Pseudonocardia hydrocarbonoxydans]|uniref:Uncharacterized protein n=1 Tax=Pseudonocardia hydrocarbonoxydans TaxID=76726 RepID=A0A4Y3WPA9_9PSEU|nr:hypothetical protein PHY01_14990 [Pseudonocardia hydrocarbonoxydans]
MAGVRGAAQGAQQAVHERHRGTPFLLGAAPAGTCRTVTRSGERMPGSRRVETRWVRSVTAHARTIGEQPHPAARLPGGYRPVTMSDRAARRARAPQRVAESFHPWGSRPRETHERQRPHRQEVEEVR